MAGVSGEPFGWYLKTVREPALMHCGSQIADCPGPTGCAAKELEKPAFATS
jgi:hypothetical protein